MMARLGKNNFFRLVLAVIFLCLLFFAVNGIFYLFNKGYMIWVLGRPVVVLGFANKIPPDQRAPYPHRLAKSFQAVQINGRKYGQAKYEKNVFINKVDEATIYAADAYSNEKYKLFWSKDSGYACVSQPYVELPEGTVDPSKKDLKGIKFFFIGNSWRGALGAAGLKYLTSDLNPGDPAKLYLVSEEKDGLGRYEVLQLVLFTSKGDCVNLGEVKEMP